MPTSGSRRLTPPTVERSSSLSRQRSGSRPLQRRVPSRSPPPAGARTALRQTPLPRPQQATESSRRRAEQRPPWQDVALCPQERSEGQDGPSNGATNRRLTRTSASPAVHRAGGRSGDPVPRPATEAGAHDDRPIVARGFYDLDFFDGDNEYESYGLEAMQRDEQRFQGFFQEYLALLGSDAVTDDDFDREWTYERLVELDLQLVKRGGLTSSELRKLLAPKRGIITDCCICMEKSTPREKMASLVCDHAFHVACLQEWLASHYTCPLCRHDLRDTKARAVNNFVNSSDEDGPETANRRQDFPDDDHGW